MLRLSAMLLAVWMVASGGGVLAGTCADPGTGKDDGSAPCAPAGQPEAAGAAPAAPTEQPRNPALAVLICRDPHTGATRQSDTGDCMLGEQQVLPQASAAPAPRHRLPAAAPSPCLAPTPAVVEAERVVRAGLAGASRPYVGATVHDISDAPVNARNVVLFSRGRIIVEAVSGRGRTSRDGEVATAELASLSTKIEVAGALPGWSRLTLACSSAKCWSSERPTGGRTTRPTEESMSFLLADAAQAEKTAQAFAELIRSCRVPSGPPQ